MNSTSPTKNLSVLEAVQLGKSLLKQELAKRLASRGGKPASYTSQNLWAEVVFAVWDRSTDTVRLYDATKRGSGLRFADPATPPIRVSLNSGVSSRYSVSDGHSTVVGLIYPVLEEKKVGKKTVIQGREIVHVPYSKEFYVPAVLAAGSDYLSFLIQGAFDELRAKGIKSRTFPDKLLVDVIDPYLIKSIAVIEHTSHRSLLQEDGSEDELGYFLVQLGLNGEDTFDTSVSTAGAAGLVQFIPSTYRLLVKGRPDLGLIADFKTGMANHQNAVKAEVAYLDESLDDMPTEIQQAYLGNAATAAEFLAAAYNGGSTRVRRAYAAWGDDWADSHQSEIVRLQNRNQSLINEIEAAKAKVKKADKKTAAKLNNQIAVGRKERAAVLSRLTAIQKGSLKSETVWYVAKMKKVYSMLSAGLFATPQAPANALPQAVAVAPDAATSGGQLADATANPIQPICFSDGGCTATQ